MSLRPRHRFIRNSLVFLLFLLMFLVRREVTAGQQPATAHAQLSSEPQFGRERSTQRDQMEEKLEQDRKKAMNKQRQASLQKDTDKLYQLATELKNYVDKTNEHTLSLDVIKKAEEVEKLAKKVKEKMKETY